MPDLTDEQLLQIIADGESDRVEFKESLGSDSPKRIREAICAFANDLPDHQEPGYVVVGVNDKGDLVGSTVTDEMIRQLADMKSDGQIVPPPSLTVEKRTLEGRQVALVTVQVSDSPPVRCRGVIRIRTGSRRDIASAQDERILNERRARGFSSFDVEPIPTTGLSDLDLIRFQYEYLGKAFSQVVLETNERSLEEQLAATKMIASADNPLATVLGILTIGKHPQDYLPGAYIQFLRVAGNEWGDDVVDSEKIQGTFPDMLRRVNEKLVAHNRRAVDFLSGPVERRTETYPIEALLQFVYNAVMHRTYEGTNSPVRVYWFNDHIEIISPGGPYGQVTIENFGQMVTDYRNRNLADAMKTLSFVRSFGSGITTAKNLLKDAGNPEPIFRVDNNFVTVTVGANKKGLPADAAKAYPTYGAIKRVGAGS